VKKREKRIFVYGGPQVFYAADARPSGHPKAPAYILETEHERVKAQRDRLLEAAKAARSTFGLNDRGYDGAEAAATLNALSAAIADCEAP